MELQDLPQQPFAAVPVLDRQVDSAGRLRDLLSYWRSLEWHTRMAVPRRQLS